MWQINTAHARYLRAKFADFHVWALITTSLSVLACMARHCQDGDSRYHPLWGSFWLFRTYGWCHGGAVHYIIQSVFTSSGITWQQQSSSSCLPKLQVFWSLFSFFKLVLNCCQLLLNLVVFRHNKSSTNFTLLPQLTAFTQASVQLCYKICCWLRVRTVMPPKSVFVLLLQTAWWNDGEFSKPWAVRICRALSISPCFSCVFSPSSLL